ncbi:hypothetical protein A2881_04210 [Candidatus Peribacteria bacterium RIFCSPHIGHO2_01_FULL_55_13]|nr:MAG: hypothetical protein A2881_04210 [Candidatus Peribacteria bacterium RIFCSPHIGHO2_01_FULL_55_13]OGJ66723.1 MAG: hypothetical protein A3F36_04820 [Candidatus Peribacteria bacterium RIFCSPHIGHO2_12_FULL_55_11]
MDLREIITADTVNGLLDKYKVPHDRKPVLVDIIALYLQYNDDPSEFGKRAREYTVIHGVDPATANAALSIFRNVRNDLQGIVKKAAQDS